MKTKKRQQEIRVRETLKSEERQVKPTRDKSNDKVVRLDLKQNGKSTETKDNQ